MVSMAYNAHLAERIEILLKKKKVHHEIKSMMGGLCYMVDEKMCFGIHFDKKRQSDLLMARVGGDAYEKCLDDPGCEPMDFTGRTMKGYVFVRPEGFDMDEDLEKWVDRCLEFNPLATKSKKK